MTSTAPSTARSPAWRDCRTSDWRISLKLHYNHSLGPEQWLLLSLWFDRHLKGQPIEIPKTAPTSLTLAADGKSAAFVVTPDQPARLRSVRILYSH